MPSICFTPEMSQPERSRNESEEQPENRRVMSVTAETSQPERSREVREEQPANAEANVFIRDVSSLRSSMDVQEDMPSNHPAIDDGEIASATATEVTCGA